MSSSLDGASSAPPASSLTGSLTFGAIEITEVTVNAAVISWTTSTPSLSQVNYGTTVAYDGVTPPESGELTIHRVTLLGLASGALYHFRVMAQGAQGPRVFSEDHTFTTGTGWLLVQTAASTGTVTLLPTQPGNLVVMVVEKDFTAPLQGVEDNAPGGGNTYVRVPQGAALCASGQSLEIWYASHARPGVTAVTPTPYASGAVWEVGGILWDAPVDVAGAVDLQPASLTPQGPLLVATRSGDFMVQVAVVENYVTGMVPATGFTQDHNLNGEGWAHLGQDEAAVPGPHQGAWYQNSLGRSCAVGVAFKGSP